ncbi:MAG: hypothetical protein WBV82_33330, partial [Myxococcaceae bacterium]
STLLPRVVHASSEGAPDAPLKAVWVQPLGTAVFGAISLGGWGEGLLYVPVGATLAISDRTAVEFEAAWLSGRQGCGVPDGICRPFRGAHLSVGLSRTILGESALSGFFVGPKLSLESWTRDTGRGGMKGTTVVEGYSTRQILLGADIGYRRAIGNAYVAVALGASVGYAFGRPQTLFGGEGSAESPVFLAGNLNLLRVGAAF